MSIPQNQSPYLVSVGNVHATQHHAVTPSGTWPLGEVTVAAQDFTATQSKIPTWAIVLTLITVWFFLIGLLFLIVRETKVTGTVAITVTHTSGGGFAEHVTVQHAGARIDVLQRVTYLQNLIASERQRLVS